MKKNNRYVVEAIWSGYNSSQRQPCHRVIVRNPEQYKQIDRVIFTDNTYMSVSIRPCLPRERIQEIHGYDTLFSKIIHQKLKGRISIIDVKD